MKYLLILLLLTGCESNEGQYFIEGGLLCQEVVGAQVSSIECEVLP
jgi:hypothetical protein